MLDRLTVADFAARVGETFVLATASGERLDLVVSEAAERGTGPREAPRAPFYVLLRGPSEPLLPQGIYPIEHPAFGVLELFIVPVARERDGLVYEVVFG
jgi:hypothetical protein